MEEKRPKRIYPKEKNTRPGKRLKKKQKKWQKADESVNDLSENHWWSKYKLFALIGYG